MRSSVIAAIAPALALVGLAAFVGCSDQESRRPSTTQPISRYTVKGLRQVPDYLKGSIFERADLEDSNPMPVSSFGLVGQLRGTGDNTAVASKVRDYMRNELARHGYGTVKNPKTPEQVLRDPTYAVVRVDGFIPPGARQDDHFDILVSVPEESFTSSLSHGVLYRTSLKIAGADPNRPAGSVNVYAHSQGPIFVNPQYSLVNPKNLDANGRKSLRYGIVMDGGMCSYDNPLILRLRNPQFSMSRAIEQRINQRFQGIADKSGKLFGQLQMAQAMDDGIVYVYVPKSYRGDWEHFAGVVKHLYMDTNPAILATMAEKLADAAVTPDAPLENISYAWEGIGQPASAVLSRMMNHKSREVSYAAARAAAFIGDDPETARQVLFKIARSADHPFRLNAVKTLADMPSTPETLTYLRQLVNSDSNPIRVEAYRALVRNGDSLIYSPVIQEKFVLDLVPSSAPPMIYATRRGVPRISLFGTRQSLKTPVTFAAIDSRLTLTADRADSPVTIFYRADKSLGDLETKSIKQTAKRELADIIARLGGVAGEDEPRLDFSYADVVSLIQSMHAAGKLVGYTLDGQEVPITLVIEEETGVSVEDVLNAPRIPETQRPQDDRPDVTAPQIPDTDQPKDAPKPPAQPTPNGRAN